MSGPPPPKPGGGLSLYADLLDPPGDSAASISRGPQLSQQALDAVKGQEAVAAAAAAKKTDASLRFQPIQNIRRPQQKTQKPKAAFPKAAAAVPGAGNVPGSGNTAAAAAGAPAPPPVKSTLADWTNTEDDDFMFDDRRPRNKKKKKKHNAPVETDWNEIYDPSRPTNVDEYLRSDERIMEVREWKALLYRHRRPADRKRQSSWDSEDDEEQHRPANSMFMPRFSFTQTSLEVLTCPYYYRPVRTTGRILLRASAALAAQGCPSALARRQDWRRRLCSTAGYVARHTTAASATYRARSCWTRGTVSGTPSAAAARTRTCDYFSSTSPLRPARTYSNGGCGPRSAREPSTKRGRGRRGRPTVEPARAKGLCSSPHVQVRLVQRPRTGRRGYWYSCPVERKGREAQEERKRRLGGTRRTRQDHTTKSKYKQQQCKFVYTIVGGRRRKVWSHVQRHCPATHAG